MELVTAYTTFSVGDAQLIRSMLEAAGIEAEVMNEFSTLGMEGYSLASGGLKVQVRDDQLADARALIEEKGPTAE